MQILFAYCYGRRIALVASLLSMGAALYHSAIQLDYESVS